MNALVAADDHALQFTLQQMGAHKERMEKTEGQPDMMTRWLHAHNEQPEKFSDYDVIMGAYTNIVAGADTMWMTLRATMYHLMRNPKTMIKLKAEIDEMANLGKVSNPITFKETQDMPYFQAVMKETLRMHSPSGLPLWRVVPEGGATLCGKYFPPGVSPVIETAQNHELTIARPRLESMLGLPTTLLRLRQILIHSGLNAGLNLTRRSSSKWITTTYLLVWARGCVWDKRLPTWKWARSFLN